MIITLKDSHPRQIFIQGLLRTQHCTRGESTISLLYLPVRLNQRILRATVGVTFLAHTLIRPPNPRVPAEALPTTTHASSISSVAGGMGWWCRRHKEAWFLVLELLCLLSDKSNGHQALSTAPCMDLAMCQHDISSFDPQNRHVDKY